MRGHNLVTGQAIDRRYRVIDALNTEELVVEDESGRAYRVGLGRDSDIVATRVTAWRGRPMLVRSDHLEVGGRTVAEVVAALPRQAMRVYVTGVLKLHDAPTLPAISGRMARITAYGGETQLRVATPAELAGLSDMVVEDGSLVVRAEYAAGSRRAGGARRAAAEAGADLHHPAAGVAESGGDRGQGRGPRGRGAAGGAVHR